MTLYLVLLLITEINMGCLCSKRNPEEAKTKPKPKRFNIDEESKGVSNLNSTNIRPYKIKPPPRNSTSINKPNDLKPVYLSLTEVRKKYSHLFLPPIQNSTDYQDMIVTDIEKSQDSVIDYSAHVKSSPQVGQSSACNLSDKISRT